MKVLIAVALFALVAAQFASAACHNATGSCSRTHFVCANDEAVAHGKRCDGVEDCADGTDEYMCDQAPKPITELAPAERDAVVEASCVKCTCFKGTIAIASTSAAWFTIALNAPRDFTMMTDYPGGGNPSCNAAQTTKITLNVYKKKNKGCRGWVCCFRQQSCTTCATTYSSARHCWA